MSYTLCTSNAVYVAKGFDLRMWNSNLAASAQSALTTSGVQQLATSAFTVSSAIGDGYNTTLSNIAPGSCNLWPPTASYSSNYQNITSTSYGRGPYIFAASFVPTSPSVQFAYQHFTDTGQGMRTTGPAATSGTATSNSISYRPYSLYTSTIASGTEIFGAWVQVKLPEPVAINKYTVRSPYEYDVVTYVSLVASTNGLDWTHLNTHLRTWTTATDLNVAIPFNFINTTPYQYYRFIARGTATTGINQNTMIFPFFNMYSVGQITLNTATTVAVKPNISMNVGYAYINGYLGIGVNPPLMPLHLAYDGARKLSTSSWDIGSDERLKTDIIEADYATCYHAISNLPLKYFKWRDDIPELASIRDRRKLGWIAQDVQAVFPHAITTVAEQYSLQEVLVMNPDQIYAMMYGAVKQLVHEVEELKRQMRTVLGT